jgi:hypothetical protein
MDPRSTPVTERPVRGPGHAWALAAAVLTATVSLLLLVLPLFETQTEQADGSGLPATVSSERESVLERRDWGVAAALAVPVLVAAAPLPVRRRRAPVATAAAVVLGVGVVLGAASVGLFYLPSVVLLVVAAVRSSRSRVDQYPRTATGRS